MAALVEGCCYVKLPDMPPVTRRTTQCTAGEWSSMQGTCISRVTYYVAGQNLNIHSSVERTVKYTQSEDLIAQPA